MDQIPQVHAQRLIPSPSTLFADWRPADDASLLATGEQRLEIATVNQPSRVICVRYQRCVSQAPEAKSVILTASESRHSFQLPGLHIQWLPLEQNLEL